MELLSKGDKIINVFFYALLVLLIVICFYPLWYVVVASISGAFILLPKGIHFAAYEYAFQQQQLWVGYQNTILYTLGGVLLGLFVSLPGAYALSRRDLPGRSIVMLLIVFTMYFSGGMIPTYIVCSTMKLVNTRKILMIMGSISAYNIILIRTFFSNSLPDELREAAFIDGCSNTRFFIQFALPLSKAIIAVIALYIAVGHWNSYYTALIYTTNKKIQPLQLYLRQLLLISIGLDDTADPEQSAKLSQLIQVVRYAVIILSSLPIMCVYPFLQKYFVQGVMIGSVKG